MDVRKMTPPRVILDTLTELYRDAVLAAVAQEKCVWVFSARNPAYGGHALDYMTDPEPDGSLGFYCCEKEQENRPNVMRWYHSAKMFKREVSIVGGRVDYYLGSCEGCGTFYWACPAMEALFSPVSQMIADAEMKLDRDRMERLLGLSPASPVGQTWINTQQMNQLGQGLLEQQRDQQRIMVGNQLVQDLRSLGNTGGPFIRDLSSFEDNVQWAFMQGNAVVRVDSFDRDYLLTMQPTRGPGILGSLSMFLPERPLF
jgi:hypothetical protein